MTSANSAVTSPTTASTKAATAPNSSSVALPPWPRCIAPWSRDFTWSTFISFSLVGGHGNPRSSRPAGGEEGLVPPATDATLRVGQCHPAEAHLPAEPAFVAVLDCAALRGPVLTGA